MSDYPDETPLTDSPDDATSAAGETIADRAEAERERVARGTNDALFGFLLAVAVSIGLIPALPNNADMRYTLAWGALAGVGVLAWLLGNGDRIGQEEPENIGWGVGFGLMISVPFALFFFDIFGRATALLFPYPTKQLGTVLAYLVFVMPLAETLFFRGLLQKRLEFYLVGGLAGLWSVVLFFPVMWGDVVSAPVVAVFLVIALFVLNVAYSYVRERNGLAAAWVCQIIANLALFFLPFTQV